MRGLVGFARRFDDPESTERGANRFGDVAGGQVSVVLFDHPRVGVAQLLGNHRERHVTHREPASVGMT
jgi:hypothetical protein